MCRWTGGGCCSVLCLPSHTVHSISGPLPPLHFYILTSRPMMSVYKNGEEKVIWICETTQYTPGNPMTLPSSLAFLPTDCGCHPPRQGKCAQIWDTRAAGQDVPLCTWPDPGLWLQNQVWRWQEHWVCPHLWLCRLPKEVWTEVQTGTGEWGRGLQRLLMHMCVREL